YAVIRYVPLVERGEFINIGVVLYCRDQRFLKTTYTIDEERLNVFASAIDLQEIENYLSSFEKICIGGQPGGQIGMLPIADRFRWLTATRSTILQCSKVHVGYCENADE